MIFAILLIVAVTGVALQMMALVNECLRVSSGCTCSKGAVDWRCPVHGSDS